MTGTGATGGPSGDLPGGTGTGAGARPGAVEGAAASAGAGADAGRPGGARAGTGAGTGLPADAGGMGDAGGGAMGAGADAGLPGGARPGTYAAGEWLIYRGTGEPHTGIDALPEPPPWRDFDGGPLVQQGPGPDSASARRLGAYRHMAELHRPSPEELEMVNAALYLRRPLLVTGSPGTGKSTLAHAVAYELGLGRVLHWPIVSRSTLQDGLYRYDAIARLQDTQIAANSGTAPPGGIGSYVRLGPLGTALLPTARPRVLLVDELDKSDIDLPNDLLNVMEEGEFGIPELERLAEREPQVEVLTDDGTRVTLREGRVRCRAFPFVVLTSNGERDFPAPLLRRCIHLELGRPDHERLSTVVRAHLGDEAATVGDDLVQRFLERSRSELLATDQLLNAIYLTHHAAPPTRSRLADMLIQRLDRPR